MQEPLIQGRYFLKKHCQRSRSTIFIDVCNLKCWLKQIPTTLVKSQYFVKLRHGRKNIQEPLTQGTHLFRDARVKMELNISLTLITQIASSFHKTTNLLDKVMFIVVLSSSF